MPTSNSTSADLNKPKVLKLDSFKSFSNIKTAAPVTSQPTFITKPTVQTIQQPSMHLVQNQGNFNQNHISMMGSFTHTLPLSKKPKKKGADFYAGISNNESFPNRSASNSSLFASNLLSLAAIATSGPMSDNLISPKSDRSDSSLNLNNSMSIQNPLKNSFEDNSNAHNMISPRLSDFSSERKEKKEKKYSTNPNSKKKFKGESFNVMNNSMGQAPSAGLAALLASTSIQLPASQTPTKSSAKCTIAALLSQSSSSSKPSLPLVQSQPTILAPPPPPQTSLPATISTQSPSKTTNANKEALLLAVNNEMGNQSK